jgi:imidazoleglycerol-phosphate dehydratase
VKGEVSRETKETRVRVVVARGTGEASVRLAGAHEGSEPGRAGGEVAFARHMLETLSKWSGFDITIDAESKDGLAHHLVEDAAIGLGRAFRAAIDTGRVERVAHTVIPMDDALVLVALDLVERPYYEGPLPDPLMDHVLRSLATEGGFTLHVQVLRGRDPHHVTEAAFKGLARCLAAATQPRAERLSTKGAVDVRTGGA